MRLVAFLLTASRGAASGPLTELLAKKFHGEAIPIAPNLILQRLNGGGRSSRRRAPAVGAKDPAPASTS